MCVGTARRFAGGGPKNPSAGLSAHYNAASHCAKRRVREHRQDRMKLMMKGRQIGYGATLFVVVGAALTLAQGPIAPQPETISGATSHVYKSVDGIDLRIHV